MVLPRSRLLLHLLQLRLLYRQRRLRARLRLRVVRQQAGRGFALGAAPPSLRLRRQLPERVNFDLLRFPRHLRLRRPVVLPRSRLLLHLLQLLLLYHQRRLRARLRLRRALRQ